MTDQEKPTPHEEAPNSAGGDKVQPTYPGFEQLALAATVTGPGMRTEDHFERGAKLKIRGERGIFTYKYASMSKAGLVSLHLAGNDGSRAVRPDQVTIILPA